MRNMKWYERIVSIAGGLLLIIPGIVTDAVGLLLVLIIFFIQYFSAKKAKVLN